MRNALFDFIVFLAEALYRASFVGYVTMNDYERGRALSVALMEHGDHEEEEEDEQEGAHYDDEDIYRHMASWSRWRRPCRLGSHGPFGRRG